MVIDTIFCAAPAMGVYRKMLHCSALRERTSPFRGSTLPSILENCIEKNFHVSRHESGRQVITWT
jgi:hypothetical protein